VHHTRTYALTLSVGSVHPVLLTLRVAGGEQVSGRDLVGSRCYWCHGVAHNECRDQNAGVVCDLGSLRSLKLPPYAIYRTGRDEPELAWQVVDSACCSHTHSSFRT
jgi:hypothetical protein